MTSFVYMSPVAPVDDKDFVSADVMYYKLHMLRSGKFISSGEYDDAL